MQARMASCSWLLLLLMISAADAAFNATAWTALPYVQKLTSDSWCLRVSTTTGKAACSAAVSPGPGGAEVILGLPQSRQSPESSSVCPYCYHGANMIPWLIRRYGVRSLAEVGVCTGMSVVNVVHAVAMTDAKPRAMTMRGKRAAAVAGTLGERTVGERGVARLDLYYMVDPWGERRCDPGCGCARQIKSMARTWPNVLVPLRGYSTSQAMHIPNGTLDLAYIDAAHDYRNARADILAYWPKLKPTGVMAGHDFAHWRNWGEVRQDKLSRRGPWAKRTPKELRLGGKGGGGVVPAYGVAQATQELFSTCQVHVRFSTWWVEAASCRLPAQLISQDEAGQA